MTYLDTITKTQIRQLDTRYGHLSNVSVYAQLINIVINFLQLHF